VIVQNVPFVPSNSEHSFVTWRSPLRGDANSDVATACRTVPSMPGAVVAKLDTAALALGLVGTPRPSAHPTAASAPAQRHPITTNFIHPPSALPPVFLLPPMPDAPTPLRASPIGDRARGVHNGSTGQQTGV